MNITCIKDVYTVTEDVLVLKKDHKYEIWHMSVHAIWVYDEFKCRRYWEWSDEISSIPISSIFDNEELVLLRLKGNYDEPNC